MKTIFTLSSQFNFLPVVTCSTLPNPSPKNPYKSIQFTTPIAQEPLKHKLNHASANGHLRFAVVGAASLGIALLVMGMDDSSRALALGPEGPLMEEFWDNVRRYALYALTVSTGALWALLEPIVELLKNPVSAVLVILILGGGFFIVSQVLSAMVGVTDFSYDYGY
ncbi:uncharacterized protein LOC126671256 [Mercurialis annua]|uniref:uncharacterized protein LOC126671256 n=1 Tax=Mercurialis annua TaxID=3986 RepID=UPI002160CEB7|nr:uncharacterized protein LOC126671256 [Mercurialis annua]